MKLNITIDTNELKTEGELNLAKAVQQVLTDRLGQMGVAHTDLPIKGTADITVPEIVVETKAEPVDNSKDVAEAKPVGIAKTVTAGAKPVAGSKAVATEITTNCITKETAKAIVAKVKELKESGANDPLEDAIASTGAEALGKTPSQKIKSMLEEDGKAVLKALEGIKVQQPEPEEDDLELDDFDEPEERGQRNNIRTICCEDCSFCFGEEQG